MSQKMGHPSSQSFVAEAREDLNASWAEEQGSLVLELYLFKKGPNFPGNS